MQLTNYSAIDMRQAAANILDDRNHSVRRITTGKRLVRSSDDPGAISVAAKLNVTNQQRATLRTNLQNAKTFVEMQGIALLKVNDVYDRMSVLAQRATDVTLSDEDRAALDVEFQELASQLYNNDPDPDKATGILSEKFNGVNLFDQNVICGGIQNLGLTDLIHLTGAGHVIRAQTFDPHATGGTLTFEVNGGGNGEVYRVFQGNVEIFSAGDSFINGDPTANQGGGFPAPPNGIVSNRWKTSGSAANGDFDKFAVTFKPLKPTTYTVQYGASNAGLAPQEGIIQLQNASSSSTAITLQVETNSIYQIQNVTFEPDSQATELTIGENGETMDVVAKGFDTLAGLDITTAANAQAALSKIAMEADCVLYERISSVRAEVARIDERLHKLGDDLVQGEAAYGRVVDLDYAREMTHFATNTMQLSVMTSSMASANKTTDVLMPLTANQFKSAVTQRFQLI